MTIRGTITFERLQERSTRQRSCGFGTKRRADVELDLLAGPCLPTFEDREERDWRMSIVFGYLNEFADDSRYRELLERRLLHDEPLGELAAELGIDPSTARGKVRRFKQFVEIQG